MLRLFLRDCPGVVSIVCLAAISLVGFLVLLRVCLFASWRFRSSPLCFERARLWVAVCLFDGLVTFIRVRVRFARVRTGVA